VAQLSGTYVPSTYEWVRDQIELYERTGGREGATLHDTGIPVIIVAMRGAKSGNVRKIALMRVEHAGEYALVASKGGAPENPDWYQNLVAHPDEVTVQDGPEPFFVRVRLVDGQEYDEWWQRAVAVFPQYTVYKVKAARRIPLFVASAVKADAP
jgi:deazaflavin-dependent oxidoreductase (nitroreductase family)